MKVTCHLRQLAKTVPLFWKVVSKFDNLFNLGSGTKRRGRVDSCLFTVNEFKSMYLITNKNGLAACIIKIFVFYLNAQVDFVLMYLTI